MGFALNAQAEMIIPRNCKAILSCDLEQDGRCIQVTLEVPQKCTIRIHPNMETSVTTEDLDEIGNK